VSRREETIGQFLAGLGWQDADRRPLAGDASFRRYERLARPNGERAVLMDAPPPHEDVRSFVRVARLLRRLGLSAPTIHAAAEPDGLLLLEDFGDDTFTRALAGGADETALYALAIDLLVALHERVTPADLAILAPYDTARILDEAMLFVDWFLPAVTGAAASEATRGAYRALWTEVLARTPMGPPTLVLRDYHVDNLMVLPNRPGVAACGLLDFQDAVAGPRAYDLVSLLEDARRDVPGDLRARMTDRYLERARIADRAQFATSAAVLAAQRNLRIVGVFTRLDRRDGKPHYLRHLPRLWRWLEGDLAHPALAPIRSWIEAHVAPARRSTAA